jgi:hypothetical protein
MKIYGPAKILKLCIPTFYCSNLFALEHLMVTLR